MLHFSLQLADIIQHKNTFHIYYIEKQLAVDFEEILKGFNLTDKK